MRMEQDGDRVYFLAVPMGSVLAFSASSEGAIRQVRVQMALWKGIQKKMLLDDDRTKTSEVA